MWMKTLVYSSCFDSAFSGPIKMQSSRICRIYFFVCCLFLATFCPESSQGLLMRGSCQKAHKSIHFTVPGYFTSPIHINECRETVSSAIYPVVSLNPSALTLFRRHYSTCCCAIGNTSLHETELLSVDGRPPISLQYRRIEECVCVDCADLSTDRRPLLDGH